MTQATRCVAAHRVHDVAFSPDGKSVAITSSGLGGGGTLQLFDSDSGTARWRYRRAWWVDFTKGAFSADGSLLSVGGADKATILDTGDGHIVGRFRPGYTTQAYIAPDGTWLITLSRASGWVYDVRSGAQTLHFRLSAENYCLRYSPDGTRIATLGKDGIDVWDAASFQVQVARTRRRSRPRMLDGPIARLQNVPAQTNRIQFGGCSHVLVTAARNDSVIRVWDVASGTLTGLRDTAPGIAAASPTVGALGLPFAATMWLTLGDGSGRAALTSCTDGTLRVWEVTTGQERSRLATPEGFRLGAVSSGATKLATSNGGKSVEIWSLTGGPGQQPAPDAAAPDDWCPRCGAGWPEGPAPDTASGRS